jgi:precorrin-3B synthase
MPLHRSTGSPRQPGASERTAAPHARADACPGALSWHGAADGGLARIRLPGGRLPVAAFSVIASAAEDLGSGVLELTSRGNIQLRGLPAGAEAELGQRIAAAGLLPSTSHERVRNIVASPLSGLDGEGLLDIAGLAAQLDRDLCARPELAELSGRFLFAIDDGRGDVSALDADITARAVSPTEFLVQPGDLVVRVATLVEVMLDIASEFVQLNRTLPQRVWRIRELPSSEGRWRARPVGISGPHRPVGMISHGSASVLTVLAPLGRLNVRQARAILRVARFELRITPWRSIVLPDLENPESSVQELDAAGLGCDSGSPWYPVSACIGRPGCDKALGDVQRDARRQLAGIGPGPGDGGSGSVRPRVHWSGCERRCGRPADTEYDVIATSDGYRTVSGAS